MLDHSDDLTSDIVRGFSWSIAARILQISLSGAALVLLARYLGPGEFGLLTLVLALSVIVAGFQEFGVAPATARMLAESKHSHRRVARVGASLLTCLLVGGWVVLAIFFPALASILESPELPALFPVVIVLIAGRVVQRFVEKVLEGIRKVHIAARLSMTLNWLPAASSIGVVLLWEPSGRAALVGHGIGMIPYALIAAFVCRATIAGHDSGAARAGVPALPSSGRPQAALVSLPGEDRRSPLGTLLRYLAPMFAVSAGFFVYTQSDVLILQGYLGAEVVGQYGIAVKVVELLLVPAAALGNAAGAFFPLARRQGSAELSTLVKRSSQWIGTIYLPACVGLVLTADRLVPFMFGEAYTPAVVVLYIYVPYILCRSLSSVYSLALDYLGFAGTRAVIVTVSATANIILNFILIPRYGILGAAIATQVTFVPMVLLYMILMARHAQLKPLVFVADLRLPAAATAGMALLIIAASALSLHVLGVVLLGVLAYVTIFLSMGGRKWLDRQPPEAEVRSSA